MAGEAEDEIPESGAVFTFGKSKFADNIPSKFWLKNDIPLKIACGDEHTALITKNGKLFMFGSNNWGQLGLGSKVTVNKPTCVKALKSEKVQLVACGRNHTLISTAQGKVFSSGGNSEGQLGLGDCEERTAFQRIHFFDSRGPIKMLAAGSNTSAALTESGKLFMWGDNTEGQIGLGKESHATSPQEVSVGRPVSWVSCGYYHSALVTADGALYTFGERDSGKLGLGTEQLPRHRVPQRVKSIKEAVLQVACGGGHTVALTQDDIYSFGLGQFGQLGHGTFIFESRLPRSVEHFKKGRVCQVNCGENHTAVITESGLLYTFGDGRHGKLALGEENFTNQFKPTLCPRFLKYNVQAAMCGGCHMVVLAHPRDPSCGDVTLEEDDETEVFLEKPYVELLGSSTDSSSLQRSLSARVRRRERERSPDQFGTMFRTLPAVMSGFLHPPLPISSQTIPPRLPPSGLSHRKVLNGTHQHGSAGSMHQEQTDSVVESLTDTDSVKGLGETSDFLNMTHVMKMDGDKTLTLSPIQKKKGKHAKGNQKKEHSSLSSTPTSQKSGSVTPRRALPAEHLRSPGAHSLASQISQTQNKSQQNEENLTLAVENLQRRPGKSKPQSLGDSKKAASKPKSRTAKGKSQLMEVVRKPETDPKQSPATRKKDLNVGSESVKEKQFQPKRVSVKSKPIAVKSQQTGASSPGEHSQTDSESFDSSRQEKSPKFKEYAEFSKKSKNEKNVKEAKSKEESGKKEQASNLGLIAGAASLAAGAALIHGVMSQNSPSPSESSHSVLKDNVREFTSEGPGSTADDFSNKSAVSINIIPAAESPEDGTSQEESEERTDSGTVKQEDEEEQRTSADVSEEEEDVSHSVEKVTDEEEEEDVSHSVEKVTDEEEEEDVSHSLEKVTDEEEEEDVSHSLEKVTEDDEEEDKDSDTLKAEGESETDAGSSSKEEDESSEENEEEEESETVGSESETVGSESEDETEDKDSKDSDVEEEEEEEEESEEGSSQDTESKGEDSENEEEDEEEDEDVESEEEEEESESQSSESSEESEKSDEESEAEEGEEEEEEAESSAEEEEEESSEEEKESESETKSEEEEEEEEESDEEEEEESEEEEEEKSDEEEEEADSTDDEEEDEEEEEEEEEVKKKTRQSARSGRKLRSTQAADESEEFWDDVLPQYLNLK
ncbi:X-linked retinitis pigmentosa GTPase regulator-like isoform X1 [Cheilinus undulatus]|uniref:X-linked retinitis pigmentosa GTPase regulator-like isoform X1 n=1 Tax=Cheilinus undulatus TaxID=241271 RepID=UPI001BD2FBAB|nr:X-linked retinitis pigmentosa GTPase regulator-like isoform X1 [Cheilinus undulatus]